MFSIKITCMLFINLPDDDDLVGVISNQSHTMS